MTESLLERSARYIDGAIYEGPRTINPVDGSFHEVAEGVGLVCGFSHIWTVDADQGLVVLDTSLPGFASVALDHLRRWRDAPVDTIVYTHGHVDHVGGARVFLDDAAERKRPPPTVVAHDAVVRRFDRAQELCEAGDLRLACQLAEWAAQAAPDDAEVHATRAEVYRVRRDRELSLMARGLYLDASRSSEVVSQPKQAPD